FIRAPRDDRFSPSPGSFGRLGQPPVADVASPATEAISAAPLREEPPAGHRDAPERRTGGRRADRGLEQRAPVSGRRAVEGNRRQAGGADPRAGRAQHGPRGGDRGAPGPEPGAGRLPLRPAFGSPDSGL